MVEENKKFKLVYDNQGTITGSYSGIPANDDVALIEKTVLEGEEEPTPVPAGNINITTTSSINVAPYATAQVVDTNLVAENIKKDVSILGVTGTLSGGADLDELMQETF